MNAGTFQKETDIRVVQNHVYNRRETCQQVDFAVLFMQCLICKQQREIQPILQIIANSCLH